MKRARLIIPLLLLMGCERCEQEAPATCTPACGEGFVCDQARNVCEARELPEFEERSGGRAARVISSERRPLVALIEPAQGLLLTGFVDGPQPALGVLASGVRAGSQRVGVATGGGLVVIAWIGSEGFFQVASRDVNAAQPAWSIQLVRAQPGLEMIPTYQATDDFDVVVSGSGAISLVYRDRADRALYHMLLRQEGASTWERSLIDDGLSAGLEACPAARRNAQRRGLGFEPDAVIDQQILHVAYHDADCGDLRLARLGVAGRWLVSVLDRGGEDASAVRVTGRYPSLAFDAQGRPGISYQDLSRGRLLYGVLDGEDFRAEVVDPGLGVARTTQRPKGVVGAFSTLSYDLDGQPLLTYFDAAEADIVRARAETDAQGARVWSRVTLADEGAQGFFLSHSLSTTGALTVVGEKLIPGQDGMRSELVVIRQGAP